MLAVLLVRVVLFILRALVGVIAALCSPAGLVGRARLSLIFLDVALFLLALFIIVRDIILIIRLLFFLVVVVVAVFLGLLLVVRFLLGHVDENAVHLVGQDRLNRHRRRLIRVHRQWLVRLRLRLDLVVVGVLALLGVHDLECRDVVEVHGVDECP